MANKLNSTGLKTNENSLASLEFLDSIFRGLGQVMLQNSSYAGALFLAGILYSSILFGAAAFVGAAIGTATAILLEVKPTLIRAGLFGFNGALVAIALLYFLEPRPLTWAYVVFAAASSSILMAALMRMLDTWKIPALTAPFVFTALCFLLACARFGRLQSTSILPTAALPKAATVEGVVGISTVATGTLNGLSQVFFQENAITGGIFFIALFISSRRSCGMALVGSLVGALIAWGLGAAEPAIRSGAFGFNAVLAAIALGAVFFRINAISLFYAVLGMIAATVVSAAASAALKPLGMPALTLPFVLVVWMFLLAGPLFPGLLANDATP